MLTARALSRGMGGWSGPPPTAHNSTTKADLIYSYMQVSWLMRTYARRHILGQHPQLSKALTTYLVMKPSPKSDEIYIWASQRLRN